MPESSYGWDARGGLHAGWPDAEAEHLADHSEKRRVGASVLPGMEEATRLTQSGRLAEATALIQRVLAGGRGQRTGSPHRTEEASARDDAAVAPARALPGAAASPPVHPPQAPTPATGPRRVSSDARGRFVSGAYANQYGKRQYKLYVPSRYAGQAVPLVIMLHGCTQDADDLAAGTRMNAFAERDTFLVAYPYQPRTANGERCWNWFRAQDQERDIGEPSLIAGVTRQIIRDYHVDPSRVYIVGMSAGGAMAEILAVTYPDLYAAAGIHSGLPYGAARDLPSAFAAMRNGAGPGAQRAARALGMAGTPGRIVPTIIFHGEDDTTVNRANADRIVNQRVVVSYAETTRGATGSSGAWSEERHTGQVPGGYAYTCFVYRDPSRSPLIEKWIVRGLGHAWSGGSPAGSFTDAQGPDASAAMLRFFSQHRLQR